MGQDGPVSGSAEQENKTFNVLTRDGLMVQVSIACRFRLSAPQVGWLHRNIGPNYMDTLIEPSLGSYARLVISHFSTDQVYSERRGQFSTRSSGP